MKKPANKYLRYTHRTLIVNTMEHYNVFDISFMAFNFMSFMLGMFFGATMWRTKALINVVIYFMIVAVYYWLKTQYKF